MSRLTILLIFVLTLFFGVITVSLFMLAIKMGNLDYWLIAFINLAMTTGGIYLLVYKI